MYYVYIYIEYIFLKIVIYLFRCTALYCYMLCCLIHCYTILLCIFSFVPFFYTYTENNEKMKIKLQYFGNIFSNLMEIRNNKFSPVFKLFIVKPILSRTL